MATELVDFEAPGRTPPGRPTEPTIASEWLRVSGWSADDALLLWPPDMFAFTEAILGRAEAYRFTVSPPAGKAWPPSGWPERVNRAARRWSAWVDTRPGEAPGLVAEEWEIVRDALDTPLRDITSGHAWRVCEALLTLHAMADEACAGLAPGTPAPSDGIVMRARMSELLARTGSLARVEPTRLRVLPKYHTPYGGITSRSISRYLSSSGPAVQYDVNKIRTPRQDSADGLNVLLLPWPLRVSAEDFRPLPGSIRERAVEPFGFFAFQPSEPLDVSLVDRLLSSAHDDGNRVDVVVLPESSVPRSQLADLEAVLDRNGVSMLIAGLREDRPTAGGSFGSNWVHFGAAADGQWWHYRQDKHHRWSLDTSQVQQYHLDDVLDLRVRWWEAIELHPRSVQMIERDDGHTIAALICEDIAHMDEVVELLRAVGPTMVVALLLDGPQIASRWTARYASVLADDPGSAVVTLTSYGMVACAWREGRPPSSVVALWKDNARDLREISLDADAEGILLHLDRHPAIRRAADGRTPEHDASDLRLAEITQLRAAQSGRPRAVVGELREPSLSPDDHSVLIIWAEALSQAQATNPAAFDAVVANARAGAIWRTEFDLPEPTGVLSSRLDALGGTAQNERASMC